AMRFAHDPAKGLHFGKALALPGRSRIHLVLGVGFAGRDRGLSQQRRPQGDRAAHARTERGEGGGQALRARAIDPKRGRHAPGRSVIEILPSPTFLAACAWTRTIVSIFLHNRSKYRNRCRRTNRQEAKFLTRLRTWNGSQA